MSVITNMHDMTLADANLVLAGIAYDEGWTVPELLAACAPLTAHHRSRVQTALRVTAAAKQQQATMLIMKGDLPR